MEIDKTTLDDLFILHSNEEYAVVGRINRCRTEGGRQKLLQHFSTPLTTAEQILDMQQTLVWIIQRAQLWPVQITNGTTMVLEKFFSTTIDEIPSGGTALGAFLYKLLHGADHSFVRYSAGHCVDFIKGLRALTDLFLQPDTPAPLRSVLQEASSLLNKPAFVLLDNIKDSGEIAAGKLLHLAHFVRYHYKNGLLRLLDLYYTLDAWYGMAMAVKEYGLVFPHFVSDQKPLLKASGLYHLLLKEPVAYDIDLHPGKNFLFLTGANMAGKSTFIKSVGTAVFLAHIGMGVPAKSMELSVFDGLLSNINITDNIVKGESYFFNEVQRIKATVQKINDQRNWLVLIDELFKGTNVQDAMKCSTAVVEGLLKMKGSIFILSTHLYEIGEALRSYPSIVFNYFETSVEDGQICFNYQLKEGISNDRLGYLILKNAGVVDLLKQL